MGEKEVKDFIQWIKDTLIGKVEYIQYTDEDDESNVYGLRYYYDVKFEKKEEFLKAKVVRVKTITALISNGNVFVQKMDYPLFGKNDNMVFCEKEKFDKAIKRYYEEEFEKVKKEREEVYEIIALK